MADYYVELKELAVGYRGEPLIRDINIGIEKGKIVTLIGPKRSRQIYDIKEHHQTA